MCFTNNDENLNISLRTKTWHAQTASGIYVAACVTCNEQYIG